MTDVKLLLDRVLDPVGQALTPEVARRLINLRADPELQDRIDDLCDRNTEGMLTPDERLELETLVAAGNIVSILQAKARALLAGSNAA